jgi:fructokinase
MILCCGEALIDMLPAETGHFAPHPGGAVFNTAIALGRLGVRTGFLGGVSQDFLGQMLVDELMASDVDASLSPRLDRPCTLAFVQLQNGQARYAFYDENTALRALAPGDLPDLPARVTGLFFGGISLIGEPCGTAYETLCLREAGTRLIMLDPNIRPGFIRDESRYRARLARMIAASDVVKLSDEDLHWLNPGDADAAVAALLQQGPAMVLITRGEQGADAYSGAGCTHVDAPRVTVADTVGAGDTFNAGFLAGLGDLGVTTRAALCALDSDRLGAALHLGVRAAAVTVSRPGANPPRRADL